MNIDGKKEPNQLAHDFVYKGLRTRIMHGEILPATALTLRGIMREQNIEPTDIRGAIAISGLMDVSRVGAERRKGIWGEDPKIYRKASPLHHASRSAPPLLLMYAEHDTSERKKPESKNVRVSHKGKA